MSTAATPAPANYRLVYNPTSKAVLSLLPATSAATLPTTQKQFVGTLADCQAYTTAQDLTPLPAGATSALTPQQTYAAAVAAGYTVPGVTPPLVLDLSADARNQFLGLDHLLDKQLAAGRIAPTDPVPFADITGALQSLSVANVQTMILGYGEYFAGLFAALHAPAATIPPAS